MFVLYDNAASVAAQKVRIVLAEKGLAWTTVPIDLRNGEVMQPRYLALNPRGVVPTLVHEDAVLVESTVIVEYLDDLIPSPPLRPAAALERARMRSWLRRIDEDIHRATGNVSMAIYIRHAHLAKSPAERAAYFEAMPDRDRAARQQSAIEHGTDSPQFLPSLAAFSALVDDLELALAGRSWLAGDDFSLAEAAVAPYLTRLDMLAMSRLWEGGRRPAVARWWQRLQGRESWLRTVHDAFAPPARELMLARGREAWPKVAGLLQMDAFRSTTA